MSVLLGAATTWGQEREQGPRPTAAATQAAPAASQPARDARLEVTPSEFKFGDVWQGTPCQREFTVKNMGTEPLKLTAESSCGCTVPTQPKSPLEPGESGTFTVTYDTKRIGAAHKTVTLKLAGTKDALWQIPVDGNVKAVYVATPPAPIIFDGLEADTVATKTIKLENQYERPVPLKLARPDGGSSFDIQLKEIRPAAEYELVVTTKPPLQKGFNRGLATLETDVPGVESLQFHVSANIQPRIVVTPMRLYIPPGAGAPVKQTVRVQYRTDKPVKVLDVRTDQGPVQWELLPAPPLAPTAKLANHQLRVTLPDAEQLVSSGARLLITTDDPAPEFKELALPIVRGVSATTAPTPSTAAPAPAGPPPMPAQTGTRS